MYRTLLTHCTWTAHTPLLSVVYAELGKDSPPLTLTGLPQRLKPNCLYTQDRHSLPSHIYIWYQKPSWSVPTTQWMDFCQIGQRYLQVSKEKGRIILMQVLFIPLLVNHQCACILHHWWSIRDRHLQIKDEVMETFFWNTVMESHCKNIIKKWRFKEQIWHFTNQTHAHNRVFPQPTQSINSPCPLLCVLP